MHGKLKISLPLWSRRPNHRECSTKMPPSQSYKRRCVACQHFSDDQTLWLQAGAGEDGVIHLPSDLDRVASERQEEEEDPRFPRSNHARDLQVDTLVAALPGDGPYRVSARTGLPGVSIPWLDVISSEIRILFQYSSVYNCPSRSVPEIHFACCWDVKQPTKNKDEIFEIRTRVKQIYW